MRETFPKLVSYFLTPVLTASQTVALAALDVFVIAKTLAFIADQKEVDELGTTAWATFAALCAADCLLATTMMGYVNQTDDHHHHHHHHHHHGNTILIDQKNLDSKKGTASSGQVMSEALKEGGVHTENNALSNLANATKKNSNDGYESLPRGDAEESVASTVQRHDHQDHHHHHSRCSSAVEFLSIGATFGILTFRGMNLLLSHFSEIPDAAIYTVSAYFALVNTFMNYKFHTHHAHADDSCRQLFQKLSCRSKGIASYLIFGIVVGHYCQFILPISSYIELLPLSSLNNGLAIFIRLIVASVWALPATCYEANTELRLTLKNAEQGGFPNFKATSTYMAIFSSLLHSLIQPTGAIEFIDMFYPGDEERFSAQISFRTRILVYAGLFAFLGIPNGVGFYNAVIGGSRKSISVIGSFFGCKKLRSDVDAALLESGAPNPFGNN